MYTTADIQALRREALAAGDTAQVDLCDLALSLPDLRAEQQAEDAGHEDTDHQRAFGRPIEERLAEAYAARDACEAAIQAAEALADE